jgi:hypothetical protein
MTTTPPPIITGSKVRSTRDHFLGTGAVCCVYADYGQAIVRFGSFPLPHLMNLSDLRIVDDDPRPTRLSLAKVALEAAEARCAALYRPYAAACAAKHQATCDIAAAESEAAQLAAIPPRLLEVAREIHGFEIIAVSEAVALLARSHSVDPAVLRAAMGVGK